MSIWDILFPARCVGCGRLGRYLCHLCSSTLQILHTEDTICPMCHHPSIDGLVHPRCRTRFSPDGLLVAFRYEGVMKKAIKAIKYRSVTRVIPEIIGTIPQLFWGRCPKGDCLLPIPLHSSRLRERGFNQSELFAREISRKLNIPVRTDILQRIRRTPPQASLTEKWERVKNLAGAFAVKTDLPGQRVLLIDDVTTTGATVGSAVRELKKAGANQVWIITIAR